MNRSTVCRRVAGNGLVCVLCTITLVGLTPLAHAGGHDSHGHDSHGHDSHGHEAHGHEAHGTLEGPTPAESPWQMWVPLENVSAGGSNA